MKTLGIIPARAGSKRVARKNVRDFCGKPLIAWTIECARKSSALNAIVVSSDDQDALAIAQTFEGVVALPRPIELATDTAPAVGYVKHALAVVPGGADFDTVVILQPTSPLRLPSDIDATVELLADPTADSAVSTVLVAHDVHPLKMKKLRDGKLLPYVEEERGRMMAHELDAIYVRNCAVYATRRRVIDSGQIVGNDCRSFEMPRERSVDINDEIDFELAELLMKKRG